MVTIHLDPGINRYETKYTILLVAVLTFDAGQETIKTATLAKF